MTSPRPLAAPRSSCAPTLRGRPPTSIGCRHPVTRAYLTISTSRPANLDLKEYALLIGEIDVLFSNSFENLTATTVDNQINTEEEEKEEEVEEKEEEEQEEEDKEERRRRKRRRRRKKRRRRRKRRRRKRRRRRRKRRRTKKKKRRRRRRRRRGKMYQLHSPWKRQLYLRDSLTFKRNPRLYPRRCSPALLLQQGETSPAHSPTKQDPGTSLSRE